MQAAEELDFYQEAVFKNVVYTEIGLLVFALVAGVFWEFFVRNKDSGKPLQCIIDLYLLIYIY